MQTAKGRASPKESPTKISPRPARQLKISPVENSSSSPSSNAIARTPKDKSPKVTERRTPRSLVCEKRPSKLSELESQIAKLQNDLKTVKDQLVASESLKKEAQADNEDLKKQLTDVSLKLEESHKQLSEIDVTKNGSVVDQHDTSQEAQQLDSALDDSASLNSALDEIKRLKQQLENVSKVEDARNEQSHATNAELQSLKKHLAETSSVVESMKYELEKTKEAEAQAQNLVNDTLIQLQAAKETVNALRSDVIGSKEAYNSIVSELQHSRAQVSFLESYVNNLKKVNPTDSANDQKSFEEDTSNVNELKMELETTRSEVRQLRTALEASELRFDEEQARSTKQIENAGELLEKFKAESALREAELAEELGKAKAKVDELKSSLMDKETELQAISEENENLNKKLEKSASCHTDPILEAELTKLKEHLGQMKAQLMDKGTEVQNVAEENEMLKLEISKREVDLNKKLEKSASCHTDPTLEAELIKLKEHLGQMKAQLMDKETEVQNVAEENEMLKLEISKREVDQSARVAELEAVKAAHVEAATKLGYMMEEADKSNRKVVRVTEQLETAQGASADMEAELRRLKVQTDQWRKAAEAAASMLSPGTNEKFVGRTGSMPLVERISSPYVDDYDDESFKKKNGNVLKKIGVLWKRPQK